MVKAVLQFKLCFQHSKRMMLFIECAVFESHFKLHRENPHHRVLRVGGIHHTAYKITLAIHVLG